MILLLESEFNISKNCIKDIGIKTLLQVI
jgi:hypothetical protein